MAEKDIQEQINDINTKLDTLLQYANQQRLKSDSIDDLVSDLSIIGNDVYKSTVNDLEDRGVDIDAAAIKELLFKLLRNVDNFNSILETFESLIDFLKDAGPIANEIIIDFINKLHDFDTKGHFRYIGELLKIVSVIQENYSIEDIKKLSSNIPVLMNIMKNLLDTDTLKSLEKISVVVKNSSGAELDESKSLFKLLREVNSPEVRMALTKGIHIVKEINK